MFLLWESENIVLSNENHISKFATYFKLKSNSICYLDDKYTEQFWKTNQKNN